MTGALFASSKQEQRIPPHQSAAIAPLKPGEMSSRPGFPLSSLDTSPAKNSSNVPATPSLRYLGRLVEGGIAGVSESGEHV